MNPLTRSDSLFGQLFADPEIENLWANERFVAEFRAFEAALAEALAEAGIVDSEAARGAARDIATFEPETARIAAATLADGVPVPEFVRQLKAHVSSDALPAIHTGATSQDLIDTALVRILRDANDILEGRLTALAASLDDLAATRGDSPLMGRTRMQAALPITVADRIASWRAPLAGHLGRLADLRPRLERLQFGGAVGTRAALAPNGDAVAAGLAQRLDLSNPESAWHTDRTGVADYAGWLSLVTGSLGKFGQDICLMAQQGIEEIALSGGGTSSAMPHKQNPVLAETLVALARFNAAQLSAVHMALVHEQERSGAAWTLEWMTLPGMVAATGVSLLHARRLIEQIQQMGTST